MNNLPFCEFERKGLTIVAGQRVRELKHFRFSQRSETKRGWLKMKLNIPFSLTLPPKKHPPHPLPVHVQYVDTFVLMKPQEMILSFSLEI